MSPRQSSPLAALSKKLRPFLTLEVELRSDNFAIAAFSEGTLVVQEVCGTPTRLQQNGKQTKIEKLTTQR